VNLPPRLPAPLHAPRIAHDKLATAVDVIAHDPLHWVYRTRRGRPGTVSAGDENDVLRVSHVSVVRHGWRNEGVLGDDWLARVGGAMAEDDPVA
jgi:hypothetical protein